jgi:hypothetical protein
VRTVNELGLQWPQVAPGAHDANVAARRRLEAEPVTTPR